MQYNTDLNKQVLIFNTFTENLKAQYFPNDDDTAYIFDFPLIKILDTEKQIIIDYKILMKEYLENKIIGVDFIESKQKVIRFDKNIFYY